MHTQTWISTATTVFIPENAGDPKTRTEHVIEDRDSKSRTVVDKRITETVEPDVDVQDRPEIMGDEGPVADDSPFNKNDREKAQ